MSLDESKAWIYTLNLNLMCNTLPHFAISRSKVRPNCKAKKVCVGIVFGNYVNIIGWRYTLIKDC
ncbi:hypothetical protein BLOT_008937 [Blomia tropicalis]|nr:hypothetical protein BLOT_008937 [Blomia tropicalis]